MGKPINRLEKYFQTRQKTPQIAEQEIDTEILATETFASLNSNPGPALDPADLKKGFQELQEEEEDLELEFDGNDFDDFDDDDFDDDDDDDDDDEYLKEKLRAARDPDSVITESRVIFQKDSKGKLYMVARLDEMDLPEDFSAKGDEMFRTDLIVRIFGKAYCNPKITSEPINPKLFKKKNWEDRI